MKYRDAQVFLKYRDAPLLKYFSQACVEGKPTTFTSISRTQMDGVASKYNPRINVADQLCHKIVPPHH